MGLYREMDGDDCRIKVASGLSIRPDVSHSPLA